MNIRDLFQTLIDAYLPVLATSGKPAEASPPATSSALTLGEDTAEWLCGSVRRLTALLSDSLGEKDDSGTTGNLFSALCLLSGLNLPLRKIIAALPTGNQRFGIEDTLAAMGNLGFHVQRQSAAPTQIGRKFLPVLLVPDEGEPSILFYDEQTGRRRLYRGSGAVAELPVEMGSFTGWSFRADSQIHPLSKTRRGHTGHSWFVALLTNFRAVAVALGLMSMALSVAAVMLPIFTIQIYTQVIGLGSLSTLPVFIVGMGIVIAMEVVLLSNRARVLAWVAGRLEFIVSTASFDRLLRVRPSLSERAAVTDQAARLRTFESVRAFITGPMFAAILDLPVAAAALVVIWLLAGWLWTVVAAGIVCHVLLFLLVRRNARVLTSIAADETTEMQRLCIETFEKREAIRESGLHHHWSDRLVRNVRRDQRAQLLLRMSGAFGEAGSSFILTTTTILLLAGGAHSAWAGQLTSGTLLAVTILGMRALSPFHILCLSVQRVEQLRNSIRQLNSLMEIPVEGEDEQELARIDAIKGAVSFVNTGFRGSDTRPIFVGLELDIVPGEIIGVTGANGSGKTTVLKLVQGMADLSLGAVRIDGVDIRQLPFGDLRSRISYVPQYPTIFPGTLRDNLLFANPLADIGLIDRNLQVAGLATSISALPGGLDHVVTAESAFSAEFQFKFALAQALLGDSRLILIDEIPNALLDGPVGALIRQLLATVRRHRTVIFVAHRSDFLSLADRVILLRYGKIPLLSKPQATAERAA